MILLPTLFNDFCTYMDGKLKWAKPKGKAWTDTIFSFFSAANQKEIIPYIELKEYMYVDYIWRYDPKRYGNLSDIEMALEHEGGTYVVREILADEVSQLVDIKARYKIGIFYPSPGDEAALLDGIAKMIGSQSDSVRQKQEEYLIILGYTTTKEGRRVIQFKGFIFDNKGQVTDKLERMISQATKSPHTILQS